MNRKAKRNKHHILEQKYNSLRNDYFCNISSKNYEIATLKFKLSSQKEETEKYKQKYAEQLKKEFLDGNKQLMTLSIMITKEDQMCPCSLSDKNLEEDRKKYICHKLAEALYGNYDALRQTEGEVGTIYDLVLVKWNQTHSDEDWNFIHPYYPDLNKPSFTINEMKRGRTADIKFNRLGEDEL